jgi:hypothetical protein
VGSGSATETVGLSESAPAIRFAISWAIAISAALWPAEAVAATLKQETLQAWEEYIQADAMTQRQRVRPGGCFLWTDQTRERAAAVRQGEIVVAPAGPGIPKKIPSGLVHHWIGAEFLQGVTIADALAVLRDYARYKDFYSPAVADSQTASLDDSGDRFSMVLTNKLRFHKLAVDADYRIQYFRVDARRVYSISQTTRIQEIVHYGTAAQYTLPEGEGTGYIWRLYSISRFEQRDGGLYVEVELMALSRDIPSGLHFVVEPIVRRTSRESLIGMLRQTGDAVHSMEASTNRNGHAATLRSNH